MPALSIPLLLAAAMAAGILSAPAAQARSVEVGPDEVAEARARLRFATVVVLPPNERILDWICGDAEYWSVQGEANLAFVKPTAAGIRTNVTLVTDQGNVYTLLFRELGDDEGDPDLKLFVSPRRPEGAAAVRLQPVRFEARGAAAAMEDRLRQVRAEAVQAAERARSEADQSVEAFRSSYPGSLRFDYELGRGAAAAPFRVRAMWRDDRFTYLRADPDEVAALYESRDGEPSLVPYEFSDGLYVTRRPLADGWLQIGKRKLVFRRRPAREVAP